MTDAPDAWIRWLAALEARHTRDLTFPEIRRGAVALSSLYVERRERLGRGAALDGAGKRAAFALYYGPLHLRLVQGIVRALGAALPSPRQILDLGCGTGVAGAAWALEGDGRSRVHGVDASGWAAGEARWTLHALGLRGEVARGDAARASLPGADAVVAAFSINELDDGARAGLLPRLLASRARLLVVEPLARRNLAWWEEWEQAFRAAGGRADEWRLPTERPEIVARFDHATRLDHRVLTGRSLYLPARPEG